MFDVKGSKIPSQHFVPPNTVKTWNKIMEVQNNGLEFQFLNTKHSKLPAA